MCLINLNVSAVLMQTVGRWRERTVLLVGRTQQLNTGHGRLVFSGTTSTCVEERYCPRNGSFQLLTVSQGESFTNGTRVLGQNFSQHLTKLLIEFFHLNHSVDWRNVLNG